MAPERETTFDEAAAKHWIEAVEEYNHETEDLLNKVAECIDGIQEESEGPMVVALTQVASGLATGFKELVSSLCDLVVALQKIIDKFRAMVDNVVGGIKSAAKNMLGGLDVNVTV